MMDKPKVCVDFDGVLNTYDGWQGEDKLFNPRVGAREFLQALSFYPYSVVIFTTRDEEKIWKWLEVHGLDEYVDGVTNIKEGALAYIDDRAICFDGDYDKTFRELNDFKAHWE